jgi:lantibiotic biosynthesis protein
MAKSFFTDLNMNASPNIYQSANFFMMRNALLSFTDYLEIERASDPKKALLDFYDNHGIFQEAIAIASPNLHKAIRSTKSREAILKRDKIYLSLLKYFLRMSSRVTPFGLFSSVSWGKFGEESHLELPLSSLKRAVKPDMEWVRALNKSLHLQPEFIQKLRVMRNPNISESRGRFFLIEQKESKTKKSISIKKTLFTEQALLLAKNSLPYSELEEKLCVCFSQYGKEKITDTLNQMFKEGFLLSEISVQLDSSYQLKNTIDVLEGRPEFLNEFETLKNISGAFEEYKDSKIGQGIPSLEKLLETLDAIEKVDYPVHVDTALHNSNIKLNQRIQNEICEVASALWLLAYEGTKSQKVETKFGKFKLEFQEKYGIGRLVPLLELIDDIKGMGSAFIEENIESLSSRNWALELLAKSSKEEIVIDSVIESLSASAQSSFTKAPLSLEIYFDLLADSEKNIDNGEYKILLNPVVASAQAGNTFGRFFYAFDQASSKIQSMQTFLKLEETLLEQAIFVEASFLPKNARTANVSFFEKTRQFQLQMHFHEPSESIITLDDIYIGATIEHLYIYSKRLQKELHISLSTAVNPALAPPSLKLLLDISQSRFTSFTPFIWQGVGEKSRYLPRVRFKNTILCPRRWLFDYESLKIKPDTTLKAVEKSLLEAFEKEALPDNVYLTQFDHRLFLRWKNSDHLKLIAQHFMNYKQAVFFECLFNESRRPVKSDRGEHAAEFVLPLVKKAEYKIESKIEFQSTQQATLQERLSVFDKKWIYAKLFLPSEHEELFLREQLPVLIKILEERKLINSWFYIRYKEGKSHVRLRLQSLTPDLNGLIMGLLSDWASRLMIENSLGDFTFNIYDREVERYGGVECIQLAEDLFCADSQSSLYLLNIFHANKEGLPLFALAALGIVNMLLVFFHKELALMVQFLSFIKSEGSLLTGFRDSLKQVADYVNKLFFEVPEKNINTDPLFSHLNQALSISIPAIEAYERQISELEKQGLLWNSKSQIIDSMVHMHCNRMMGPNIEEEKRARIVAYHILNKIEQQGKKK